ncbi:MAG: NAD(P)-binding protein [Pirellulales bacterium]
MTTTTTGKQKVAILGSGAGAMTAAYELTSQPGWSDKYDVTIYQLGWRLGGKGASGRDAQNSQRILEHGLHVWGGFYENAFAVMQRCYAELGRDPSAPLATWQDAFKPKNDVLWEEYVGSRWIHWPLVFTSNGKQPGDGTAAPTLWECVLATLDYLKSHVEAFVCQQIRQTTAATLESWVVNKLKSLEFWKTRTTTNPGASAGAVAPHELLPMASQFATSLATDPAQHDSTDHAALVNLLSQFRDWLKSILGVLNRLEDALRRLWILADLTITGLIGCLVDGVLTHGFDIINDTNWVDWLARHGASSVTLQSAPVRGWHDYFFAYRKGDPNSPCIEAGTSMRQLVRLLLQSKGAIFWEMQAGMGDVVFAPLYQVLQRRGVHFQFFHKVNALHLDADKQTVEAMDIGIQATLINPGEYQPLVDVKGLPCWPSTPLYDQLIQGEELQSENIDLESPWSEWPDVETVTLRKGVDFDLIVIGTSLEPLRDIAAELIAASPTWQVMMRSMETTATIAVQVWFDPAAEAMGSIPKALMTGYTDPLQTWGDFSHLIPREGWGEGQAPGNLAYFCGPMMDPDSVPPYTDHHFSERQDERAKHIGLQALQQGGAHLFPAIAPPYTGVTGFQWGQLHDPQNRSGWKRFNAQYWRANVSPAERYVLAVPNSSQTRLRNGLSGFRDVYVCGDWVYTGLAGSIEGAVMSGMFASRAICGYPAEVPGEVK